MHQLVGELRKGHTVALAVETFFHGILGHHIVDGNVLADVADKLQKTELAHPLVVIDENSAVGLIRVKLEEFAQLFFYTSLIVLQRLFIQQITFLRLSGGVADHASGTAQQRDGAMAAALEMREHHDTHQVPNMERIGSRINAQIGTAHAFVQHFFCTRHDVMQHATPFEFFYKIHRSKIIDN